MKNTFARRRFFAPLIDGKAPRTTTSVPHRYICADAYGYRCFVPQMFADANGYRCFGPQMFADADAYRCFGPQMFTDTDGYRCFGPQMFADVYVCRCLRLTDAYDTYGQNIYMPCETLLKTHRHNL